MNTENAMTSHYDEVVFENRNKSYGAYSIRKEYDSNLSKGSAASCLFVASLFGIAYASMILKPEIRTEIIKKPLEFFGKNIKVIAEKPEPKEIKKPQIKSNDISTRVVTNEVTEQRVETQTATSSEVGNDQGKDVLISCGGGVGTEEVPQPIVQPTQTVDIAQVMPVFEGGTKALYRFLRKTLHYPKVAQQTGQEGTVLVRFIIDVTGAITGVEVIRGVGGVLDKEASRVIGLMPNWKPGMQHGTPVNVRMVLPIKFELGEE